jgi:hypothetical protein
MAFCSSNPIHDYEHAAVGAPLAMLLYKTKEVMSMQQ